ncbi:hypothetical protein XFF6166_400002 [Xanthomonas citri pv. fuscans]|nr:hypothetical protein XFF6166_400002 [Xanthomonas citri pv. fuscans]SOO02013.1 hypothetical protein XFF6960_550026 [Xanthomonas citri pv. fuscans]SOO05984.1 hypothetical protein XFF7767_560002 [Xanthomonas citri pv. fuscans]SOO11413.1 hypothetical protein XFF6970_80027 [Xanthomonas citri pv. fuscans]SOO15911.1 hypothetical protein XFF7766_690026 [Xanthomonas citri pv. fuscans]
MMPSSRLHCKKRNTSSARPSRQLAGHIVNPSRGLDGGIHAANGRAIGEDAALDGCWWFVEKQGQRASALLVAC